MTEEFCKSSASAIANITENKRAPLIRLIIGLYFSFISLNVYIYRGTWTDYYIKDRSIKISFDVWLGLYLLTVTTAVFSTLGYILAATSDKPAYIIITIIPAIFILTNMFIVNSKKIFLEVYKRIPEK